MWLRCPFHDDRNPSLSLKGQRWKCFSCGAGGDGADFVSRLYGISGLAAAKQIAQDSGLTYERDKPLTAQQRAEIRQRQDKRWLEAAWKDGVNVLYRMASTMRDAILRVVIPSNVANDVVEMLVILARLIDSLETGDRDKILYVLNGGDLNRWS